MVVTTEDGNGVFLICDVCGRESGKMRPLPIVSETVWCPCEEWGFNFNTVGMSHEESLHYRENLSYKPVLNWGGMWVRHKPDAWPWLGGPKDQPRITPPPEQPEDTA
jgi:hypothetical protein